MCPGEQSGKTLANMTMGFFALLAQTVEREGLRCVPCGVVAQQGKALCELVAQTGVYWMRHILWYIDMERLSMLDA